MPTQSDSGLLARVDGALNEPAIFCAIRRHGEKVCAHLSWIRQRDLERMPVEFLESNVKMGARK